MLALISHTAREWPFGLEKTTKQPINKAFICSESRQTPLQEIGIQAEANLNSFLGDKYFMAAPAKAAAIRRAIPHGQQSRQRVATRYGINPKTVAKWRKRATLQHAPMGPAPASTVLTAEQEVMAVAFRRHPLWPLDDGLYALQATIPPLSRFHAAGAASRRCLVVSNATASAACR